MKDSRFGNPVGGQPVHPLPRGAILLATPPQRAQPNTLRVVVECFQRSSVGWHCVVGEEASDDLLDPSPLLGDWLMHPPSQLVLDLPERCPHAIAPCYPLHEELPTAVAFTDCQFASKVDPFSRTNASGVASFIGSNRVQMPVPPLSRNGPRPLSAETPAPVTRKTLIFSVRPRIASG